MTPASASTGSGHQSGVDSKPNPSGRSLYTPSCVSWTSSRKHHAANDATTPTTAAITSRPANCRLRMIVAVSGEGGALAMTDATYPAVENGVGALLPCYFSVNGRAVLAGGECDRMADAEPPQPQWPARVLARRVEKKGLRPRLAAAVIAVLWLAAIVVFGIVEHLTDPDTFDTVWLGMWWATQTVTTVGYGDVVPGDPAGQLIATMLMIGGLSLFAVVTGVITSTFVARAQADARSDGDDPMLARMTAIETELTAIAADLARISTPPGRGAGSDPDASGED